MKLTWFGGSTFRFHLGGQIVVVGAEGAPGEVERAELLSGADLVVGLGDSLPLVEGWKPRAARRILDVGEGLRPVGAWALGDGAMVLDGEDERPLVLMTGEPVAFGRWVANAVVVVAGDEMARRAAALLETQPPRLIVLAGTEREVDAAFAQLPAKLDDVGLVALEPGLAVEV